MYICMSIHTSKAALADKLQIRQKLPVYTATDLLQLHVYVYADVHMLEWCRGSRGTACELRGGGGGAGPGGTAPPPLPPLQQARPPRMATLRLPLQVRSPDF